MNIREEFRLKKFFFSEVASERFFVFQWRLPGLAFVLYRLFTAAWTLAWLITTRVHAQGSAGKGAPEGWGAYLTNWSYVLLTIYFIVHALVSLIVYCLCPGIGLQLMRRLSAIDHGRLFHELRYTNDGYEDLSVENPADEVEFSQSTSMPWYLGILWILFNATSSAALTVTLVFWAILVPESDFYLWTNDNLQLHMINSILILIELFMTAMPVRLLHIVYPIIYGLIYTLFSIIYWAKDHNHVMYYILDWNKPGPTVGYIFLIALVILPLLQLFQYGIYRLKMFIFRTCCLR